jgi:hypothetical protein
MLPKKPTIIPRPCFPDIDRQQILELAKKEEPETEEYNDYPIYKELDFDDE